MSRLAEKAPEPKTQICKVSEEEHEIWHIHPVRLGTIKKTEEGWKLEDGTAFLQEGDAIKQLYADKGIPQYARDKPEKVKIKVFEVKPDQTTISIGHLRGLPIRTMQYREFKFWRQVVTKSHIKVEACRTKADWDADNWTLIDDARLSDAQ